MAEAYFQEPATIQQALESRDERSEMTLAAFLLMAAVWHIPALREAALPPEEDLAALGLLAWRRGEPADFRQFDLDEFGTLLETGAAMAASPEEFGLRLRQSIARAMETGRAQHAAVAVVFGLSAPDPMVRVAALVSAADLFRARPERWWSMLGWFAARPMGETVAELFSMAAQRLFGMALAAQPPAAVPPPMPAQPTGLMLIHGTVLPTSAANRPVWSVPGSGPLHAYLATQRPDLYARGDYFRWEGGYTDYAREVAAQNLRDWLALRGFAAIDAVAHSHGCNVLMAAAGIGATFGNVVLLSCPVHWGKYAIQAPSYGKIHSVRIRFDFVILGDRGAQRFPPGTIPERILPGWFVGHGATTTVRAWQREKLAQLL